MTALITSELIDLQMNVSDYKGAIKHLAKRIEGLDRLYDFEKYYECVLEREDLSSTGIGFGIAIPHGKSIDVKETTIAFGRLNKEIDWKSIDGKEVDIVFLLAVPESCQGDEHLRIISSLSRKLIHEDFREKLRNSSSKEEIMYLLDECFEMAVA